MTGVRAAVVVLAGGSGSRVGAGVNKVLLHAGGLAVIAHSVRTVLEVEEVHRVVLVCRPEDRVAVGDAVAAHLGTHDVWIVDGGAQRHDSEWCALRTLAAEIDNGEVDVVAIHDGARPLATEQLFRSVVTAAAASGGAIPVLTAPPLSRRDGSPAPSLLTVQTPQAFDARALLAAYRRADTDGFRGTDTASCVERYADPHAGIDAVEITAVAGERTNVKVTYAEDVALVEELLRSPRPPRG